MLVLASVGLALLLVSAYAWFEAGWLRARTLDVRIRGLPRELDGLTIGHLSDFHLGAPLSRGNRASEQAAEWVAARRPDIVCITGDLVSHPRGEPRLRRIMARLDRPLVVLGNHDVAVTRDPFSRAVELRDLERARLLGDEALELTVRGVTITVVGVHPESYRDMRARPHELGARSRVRLLLCHFPRIVERMPPESFDLILAGHLHAGQICIPIPGRRFGLAHPRAQFLAGLYRTSAGAMHVSPGTGTTFVPRSPSSCCERRTRLAAVEGHAVISHDVLASYAADAAREVEGVHGLVDGPRRHLGVRIVEEDAATTLELHVAVDWGVSAPDVAAAVQARVAEFVTRTTGLTSVAVDVVVTGLAPPAP